MKAIIVYLFLLQSPSLVLAQTNYKRLTFIVFINDEIPFAGISNGKFIFENSSGQAEDSVNFKYEVGNIVFDDSSYKKLFQKAGDYSLFIKFSHQIIRPVFKESMYETNIPKNWLNEQYIILKLYDRNKKNNFKYFFKPEEKYLTQVIIPASSTLLIERRK